MITYLRMGLAALSIQVVTADCNPTKYHVRNTVSAQTAANLGFLMISLCHGLCFDLVPVPAHFFEKKISCYVIASYDIQRHAVDFRRRGFQSSSLVPTSTSFKLVSNMVSDQEILGVFDTGEYHNGDWELAKQRY